MANYFICLLPVLGHVQRRDTVVTLPPHQPTIHPTWASFTEEIESCRRLLRLRLRAPTPDDGSPTPLYGALHLLVVVADPLRAHNISIIFLPGNFHAILPPKSSQSPLQYHPNPPMQT